MTLAPRGLSPPFWLTLRSPARVRWWCINAGTSRKEGLRTVFVNAATCDAGYSPSQVPILVEFVPPTKSAVSS